MTAKRLSRRALLRRGALGLGVAGLSLTAWRGRGYPEPPAGLQHLSPARAALLVALAETFCEAPGLPPIEPDKLVRDIDAFLPGLPQASLELLDWLLLAFEHGTVMQARLGRFSELSRTDRAAYLRSWQHSGLPALRNGFAALKSLLLATCWDDPLRARAVGFAGPVVPNGYRCEGHERYDALRAPPGTHPEDPA